MSNCKVLVIRNQKGGMTKATTTANVWASVLSIFRREQVKNRVNTLVYQAKRKKITCSSWKVWSKKAWGY